MTSSTSSKDSLLCLLLCFLLLCRCAVLYPICSSCAMCQALSACLCGGRNRVLRERVTRADESLGRI